MFKGSIPALITPFRNGHIDKDALKHLIDWHIEQGSHALVAVGTTGESPTLSHQEHQEVVRIVVEHTQKRIPVIAGSGSNNTTEALALTQFIKDVGADAALVVTPYYNKPNAHGLYAHFKALNAIGVPIIIYNIPSRCVIDMTPKTMAKLAKLDAIIGVKDAIGSVERVSLQRQQCGSNFIQLSGDDASALGFCAHGGCGCISVAANIAPRLCAEMQNIIQAGDYSAALDYQTRLMPLFQAVFIEAGVAGAKYGVSLLNRCRNEVRLPLMPLQTSTKIKIKQAMQQLNLLA